jgi:nucleotide-binding universal stress UspA family protein
MSIFPTKILLATDGSSEVQLTARTAVDLAQKTDSELHAVHVVDVASSIALLYPEATDPKRVENIALLYPEPTDPKRVEQLAPVLKEALERPLEQRGREVLDGEVERVRSAGGTVASDDGRGSTGDRPPSRGSGGRSDSDGQQGPRGDKESAYGQRIRVRGQARPLPGHDSPRVRSNHDLRRRRIPRTSPREASPKSGLLPGPLSVA